MEKGSLGVGLVVEENIQKLSAEIDNKGFFVTSTEALINWARTGSLHWMTFGLACCAIETVSYTHLTLPTILLV